MPLSPTPPLPRPPTGGERLSRRRALQSWAALAGLAGLPPVLLGCHSLRLSMPNTPRSTAIASVPPPTVLPSTTRTIFAPTPAAAPTPSAVVAAAPTVVASQPTPVGPPVGRFTIPAVEQFAGRTVQVAVGAHPATASLEQLVPGFTAQTGVQVQFAKLAPGQLYTAQSAALSSGSGAYDLVGWFANLAFLENGWLWSVDDLQQNEKLTDPSLLALGDFFPHFLDVFRSHGKLWGLPLYGESLLLYYNRSELKSVGVTAAPNTVAALDQVCKLITDAGRMAGIAMRGTVQNADVYNFLAWLYGFGGSWIDSQTMEVGLGQPEAVAAATSWGHFMRDYGPPDVANYYWTDVLAALAHQRAAIVLDSSGFGPSLEDRTQSAVAGNVGYAPLPEQVGPDKAPLGPRATNGRLGYSCAPYALSVARSSKQPEAAWLFLQWATSPPVLLASSQRTRHADAPRQSVVASPRFAEQYGYAQGAYVRQLGQSFSMAMPGYWPLVATGTDLTAALGQALTQIVTNQATPRDALAAAQEASVQIQQQAGLLK